MRKLLSAVLLLCAPLCAFGQGATVLFPPAVNQNGGGLSFAKITFCTTPATLDTLGNCTNTVSVFKDQALTQPYASAILTDGIGYFPPNANTATSLWFSPAANLCYTVTTSSMLSPATNPCIPFSVSVAPGSSPSFAALTVTGSSTLNGGTLNGTYGGNPTLSGNVLIGGTLGVTGASSLTSLTLNRIFGICETDGTGATTPLYPTLESTIADSTNCKAAALVPGFNETAVGNVVLSRSSFPIFCQGTCTLALGTNQITVAGTVNGVSIVAPYCALSSGSNQCFKITYTGTAQAIKIGDSSTHSKSLLLRGVWISTTGNGAVALQINNLDQFSVEDSYFTQDGGTTPISIQTVGTGTFVGSGVFFNDHIVTGGGTNGIGYQFQNLSTNMLITGGNIVLDGGGSANCIDVQGASTQSIHLDYVNANTCSTAVKVDNGTTSAGAIYGIFRIDNGVTTCVNYGTGTNGNRLEVDDSRCLSTAVVDSGTAVTNSVFNAFDLQWNSRRWRVMSEAGATGFEIVDQSDNSQAIAKGVGGAVHMDSSNGNPARFNQNTGDGIELWKSGAAVFAVDNAARATFKEAAAPSGLAGNSLFWADSTAHLLKMNNNNTVAATIVGVNGATSQKSETGADASLLSFTPPSVASTWRVCISMQVSAQNTATLGWTATWTDANGSAQAPTNLALQQTGVAAPALTFTAATNGNYYGCVPIDINNAGTAVVVKTTFTGTSIAYKASATIERAQ